jgi:CheY-like chemotaxis protein
MIEMFADHIYLYVEDDAFSRDIMKTMLQRVMQVERFLILDDSTDFLAKLKDWELVPDVILLDIHMRPFTGIELLQMIRADSALCTAKVVALTASVMNEEVEALRLAGFDSTIAKPISAKTFPGLIQLILQGEPVWDIT